MSPAPALVLAVALILPGMGQVLNGQARRGLTFALFALLLGAATALTAPPEASFVGRVSGGLFVHALAAMDAYRRARLRIHTLQGAETPPSVGTTTFATIWSWRGVRPNSRAGPIRRSYPERRSGTLRRSIN